MLNLPRIRRSLLAQLRSGILHILVEMGRFWHVEMIDLMCVAWRGSNVDDGLLFVCMRNTNIELRTVIIHTGSAHNNGILNEDPLENFINIMMSLEKDCFLYAKPSTACYVIADSQGICVHRFDHHCTGWNNSWSLIRRQRCEMNITIRSSLTHWGRNKMANGILNQISLKS